MDSGEPQKEKPTLSEGVWPYLEQAVNQLSRQKNHPLTTSQPCPDYSSAYWPCSSPLMQPSTSMATPAKLCVIRMLMDNMLHNAIWSHSAVSCQCQTTWGTEPTPVRPHDGVYIELSSAAQEPPSGASQPASQLGAGTLQCSAPNTQLKQSPQKDTMVNGIRSH